MLVCAPPIDPEGGARAGSGPGPTNAPAASVCRNCLRVPPAPVDVRIDPHSVALIIIDLHRCRTVRCFGHTTLVIPSSNTRCLMACLARKTRDHPPIARLQFAERVT